MNIFNPPQAKMESEDMLEMGKSLVQLENALQFPTWTHVYKENSERNCW